MDENLVSTIYGLVKILDINVSRSSVIHEVEKLPDAGDFFSISDILAKWHIETAAYQLSAEELLDEYSPFIASIAADYGTSEFVIVTAVHQDVIELTNHKWDRFSMPRIRFNEIYNGAVLFAETDERSGELDYPAKRNMERLNSVRTPLAIISAILVITYALLKYDFYEKWVFISAVFKGAGLVTAILLLMKVTANEHSLLQKICKFGKDADCDSILSSSSAKILPWLSWSDVGFCYFTGTLVALLIGGKDIGMVQILAYLSFFSLPYVIYSLSYQAFVVKKWCVLCCIVQLCLIGEALNFFIFTHGAIQSIDGSDISITVICGFVTFSAWLFLQPVFAKSGQLSVINRQLSRFKYNQDLFQSILTIQPKYSVPDKEFSILLGNPDSEKVVTVVSNPYCMPCGKTHMEIDDWLKFSDDVQIRVILTDSMNDNTINKHLLSLEKMEDNRLRVREALSAWYGGSRDYNKWSKLYPVNFDPSFYDGPLTGQKAWCENAHIEGTPLVIIDGYKLPESYKLADLKYLL